MVFLALLVSSLLFAPQTEPAPPPPAPEAPAAEVDPIKIAIDESRAALNAGDFAKSLEAARRALAEREDVPAALYLAGASALRLGQTETAEGYLRKAYEFDQKSPVLRFELGSVCVRRGDDLMKAGHEAEAKRLFNEAVEHFDAAVEGLPDNVFVLAGRASALARAGRAEEAKQAYEAWIAKAPDAVDAYLFLAESEIQHGRIQEAVAALERIPPKDPPQLARQIHAWAVSTLYQQGLFDVVMPVMAIAQRLDPQYPAPEGTLAACYFKLGRAREAWASIKRYLALKPSPDEEATIGDIAVEFLKRRGNQTDPPEPVDGVAMPWAQNLAAPSYRGAAREKRVSAELPVVVTVNGDGKVVDSAVVRTSAAPYLEGLGLEDAALEAVGRSRFKPGMKAGIATELTTGFLIEFKPLR